MNSLLSAFSKQAQKPEAPSAPVPPQPNSQQQQAGPAGTQASSQQHSKPVPVGHASLAHPAHQHHEGATDLDLYRTFSPSDVGMWSWEATTGEAANGKGPSMWSKLFSAGSGKS